MQRNPLIQIAHNALQYPIKCKVIDLLESVNLTIQEKYIIQKSEIDGQRISEIACELNLSNESIMRIKTKGMIKIAKYLYNKSI